MRWESELEGLESNQEFGQEKVEANNGMPKTEQKKDYYSEEQIIIANYNTLKDLELIGEDISSAKEVVKEQYLDLLSRMKKDGKITDEEIKVKLSKMFGQSNVEQNTSGRTR